MSSQPHQQHRVGMAPFLRHRAHGLDYVREGAVFRGWPAQCTNCVHGAADVSPIPRINTCVKRINWCAPGNSDRACVEFDVCESERIGRKRKVHAIACMKNRHAIPVDTPASGGEFPRLRSPSTFDVSNSTTSFLLALILHMQSGTETQGDAVSADGELESLVRRVVLKVLREHEAGTGAGGGDEDELLSQAEAAALARCSVSTIREWQRKGILGRYGQGRASLVKRSELFAPKARAARASDEAEVEAKADAILKGARRG